LKVTTTKEIEASLILYGESLERNIKKLSGLKKIANYYLSGKKTQRIHDIYFDTRSNDLLEAGFGLRIRNINGKDKITLKGNSERANWGGVQRLEIEHDWGAQAWFDIISFLKKNITHLKFKTDFDDSVNAITMLRQFGFRKIQERKNKRRIRIICTDIKCKIPIVELAVDSLTFVLKDTDIHSFEVELELKESDNLNVLKSLMEELISLFTPGVQVWEFSKLSTGRAILHLWNQGILQNTLGKKNRLTQRSYEIIRAFRSSQKIGPNKL
jgi:adenylate cyclase class IV